LVGKKLFVLLVLSLTVGSFLYLWVSALPKVARTADPNVPFTAATGERLFWGKGRCHVCHRIGDRGYALRGPNLGKSKDGPAMPLRGQLRAQELGLDDGIAYLVQSIAEPNAFTVPGYNSEMPRAYEAPISLFPSEIKAIVRYLASLNGDSTLSAVKLPADLLSAPAQSVVTVDLARQGRVERGRALFFDATGPAACASCHLGLDRAGEAKGSPIGPSLTSVGFIRTEAELYGKIINPDSNIVSGYEPLLVKLRNNALVVGLMRRENNKSMVLARLTGDEFTIDKSDIKSVVKQPDSFMPSNYSELLTEQQLSDLLAYLLAQRQTTD